MIALILSGLLLGDAQQPYSAQCLMEVARLGGRDLDIRDDRLRQAAVNKANLMMQRQRELIGALQEYDRAHAAYAATIPSQVAEGKMPAGSVEAVHDRMLRDRNEFTASAVTVEVRAPSCAWPALPPAPPAS